jgi:hypothetical protein
MKRMVFLALCTLGADVGAATFTVDTTRFGDTAFDRACTAAPDDCTLAGAFTRSGASAGLDTINFNIPSATDSGCNTQSGICTLLVPTAIPTDPLTIDGSSQPGHVANTLSAGNGINSVLKIHLTTDFGALFTHSTTIRGVAMSGPFQFFRGFNTAVDEPVSYVLEGSYLGLDPNQTQVANNNSSFRLSACNALTSIPGNAAASARVGGTLPAQRNLIVSVLSISDGVCDSAMTARVQGNLFGTNAAGDTLFPITGSGSGVSAPTLRASSRRLDSDILIGGTLATERNVGHFQVVTNENNSTVGSIIKIFGNYFGLAVDGTTRFNVPFTQSVNAFKAQVGGINAGEANRFGGTMGSVFTGTFGFRAVGRNGIFSNAFVPLLPALGSPAGIFEGSLWQTGLPRESEFVPDPGDGDSWVEGTPLQNPPEISNQVIVGNQLSLDYKVDTATANGEYPMTIEFYRTDPANTLIPTALIGRDTYTAAQAQSVKTVSFALPAGFTADDVVIASANQANNQGASVMSWSPTLLNFIGNAPAFANTPTAIPVTVRTLGPYRPRGQVIIRDGTQTNLSCIAQLTPSTTNPFEALGNCNLTLPGPATYNLIAQYDVRYQSFFSTTARIPEATRSITVQAALPDRLFCNGFEDQSPFGACP